MVSMAAKAVEGRRMETESGLERLGGGTGDGLASPPDHAKMQEIAMRAVTAVDFAKSRIDQSSPEAATLAAGIALGMLISL
jgi:hypothetical protein